MTPTILAASAPPLLADLGVLIAAAAFIAYISARIGMVPIVGFLIAGVIIGPNATGLVDDLDLVNQAADIGVVLLLFTIGIEFSLTRLRQLARLILVGGSLQVGITTGIVTGVVMAFGVDWKTSVFSGLLVALSSTAIVLKLLADRKTTTTPSGRVAVGFLIFQDLAIVAMVLVVPMLGTGGASSQDLFIALGKAVGIIVVVLLAARSIMPRILDAVAKTCSSEVFLLTIVGVCFGTAYLTSLADVSVSLGAFLAGLVVSESRLSEQALSDVLPLQILFSATFFVSVGMLLDMGYLIDEWLVVAAISVGVVAVKLIGTGVAAIALRQPMPVVAGAALTLAQIGEFSFVLERVGLDAGLEPFGMSDGSQAFIAVTVVLMVLTPFGAQLGDRTSALLTARYPVAAARPGFDVDVAVHGHSDLEDHVVIAGYGHYGRSMARAFDLADIGYLITTLDPVVGAEAEREGRRVVQGDLARRFIFEQAGVERARLVVIADDTEERVHHLASIISTSSTTPILARSVTNEQAQELQADGLIEHCVADESSTVDALVSHALGHFALPETLIDVVVEDVIGTQAPQTDAASGIRLGAIVNSKVDADGVVCDHLSRVRTVTPSAAGCEECLAAGDRWVHLRMCMTCGHVGCCDSSPHRHAGGHAAEHDHPLARSVEAGENWAWCYVDRITLPLLVSKDE